MHLFSSNCSTRNLKKKYVKSQNKKNPAPTITSKRMKQNLTETPKTQTEEKTQDTKAPTHEDLL